MTHASFPGQRPARTPGERFETTVLVLILLTVGGFAGFASFSHVHDWTMTNSPLGTGTWFGWANAVVSELVPIAALLVMRRRRRTDQPVLYPACLLVGALILSVTAQLAVARPGLAGGIVSVVPALAFAALAKLVLGKASAPATEPHRASPIAIPATVSAVPNVAAIGNGSSPIVPAEVTPSEPEAITAELVSHARKAAVAVLKDTGRPITRDELRARLRIRTETASEILRQIRDTDPPAIATTVGTTSAHPPTTGNGNRPAAGLIGTVTR